MDSVVILEKKKKDIITVVGIGIVITIVIKTPPLSTHDHQDVHTKEI